MVATSPDGETVPRRPEEHVKSMRYEGREALRLSEGFGMLRGV